MKGEVLIISKQDFSTFLSLPRLFEEQVSRTPDNIAVSYEGFELTYDQLNKRANQLARLLKTKGIKPECIVAIMTKHSLEMIIGIIAILKAGGAYLPIDFMYPEDRVKYILEDSRADLLLTQKGFKIETTFPIEIIEMVENGELDDYDASNLESGLKPDSLAYLLYTSGSTGKPKGVMIEEQSVIFYTEWKKKYFNYNEENRILQLASISFDVSVEEIFSALLSGARLVLIDHSKKINIKYLSNLIKLEKVTNAFFVPSFYRVVLAETAECLQNFLTVTLGGENFPSILVEEHFQKLPQVRLINEYGPTEITVCATVYEFTRSNSQVVIGKPINHTACYILDEKCNPQTDGNLGELYISGIGLTRGYLNKPELTTQKISPNPFVPGGRMYRTGDLARLLPDGNLEFIGRIDDQVKIRGYRIELGEIEKTIFEFGSIKETVVVAHEGAHGNRFLCAYLVFKGQADVAGLKSFLSKKLPNYMIPSHFILLEKLPVTFNGKVDKQALPVPLMDADQRVELDSTEYPCVEGSKTIENRLRNTLLSLSDSFNSIENLSNGSEFKDLGMDSLIYIRFIMAVEIEFGFEFDEEDYGLFRFGSMGDLVEYIRQRIP